MIYCTLFHIMANDETFAFFPYQSTIHHFFFFFTQLTHVVVAQRMPICRAHCQHYRCISACVEHRERPYRIVVCSGGPRRGSPNLWSLTCWRLLRPLFRNEYWRLFIFTTRTQIYKTPQETLSAVLLTFSPYSFSLINPQIINLSDSFKNLFFSLSNLKHTKSLEQPHENSCCAHRSRVKRR